MERSNTYTRLGNAAVAAALLVILLLGLSLRLHEFDSSFWADEIRTHQRATYDVGYLLKEMKYPLYYLLAKVSIHVSDTEAGLRFPALLGGLGGILAIFFVMRSLFSPIAGLVAALALAVSPFHIFHSQHARYYSLLMLFGLLALWYLYRAITRGRTCDWALYVITGFLAMMSHIAFAVVLIAMNVGAGLCILFRDRPGIDRVKMRRLVLLALAGVLILSELGLTAGWKGVKLLAWPSPAAGVERIEGAEGEAGAAPVPADAVEPAQAATSTPPPREPTLEEGEVDDEERAPVGEERPSYILTVFGNNSYIEFLQRYFWMEHPRMWDVLLLFGIWGFIELWRNRRTMAVLALCIVVLPPIPFLYIEVSHWHHPRYFSGVYLPALLLVCLGLMVLPSFLSHRISCRYGVQDEPVRVLRKARWEAGLVAVLLALLAPAAVTAYETYPIEGYLTRGPLSRVKIPLRDWKQAYRYLADYIRPGDRLHHIGPRNHAVTYRALYLDRYLGNQEAQQYIETYDTPLSLQSLLDMAAAYPDRNVWFTGQMQFNAAGHMAFFAAGGAARRSFIRNNDNNGVILWWLGEPTQNLIIDGGFEDPTLHEVGEQVWRVDADDAYEGKSALRLVLAPGSKARRVQAWLDVGALEYRVRNPEFAVWQGDGLPAGWDIVPGAEAAGEADGPRSGRSALELFDAPDGVTSIAQRIPMGMAPGRTVVFEAQGYADEPDALSLVLKYDLPGSTTRITAPHPGGGAWQTMRIVHPIPAEAEPDSVFVELQRPSAAGGRVLACGVSARVIGAGNRLDPRERYTFSMRVRNEDIKSTRGEAWPNGFVNVHFTGPDGVAGVARLANIAGTGDWRLVSAPVVPGETIPLDSDRLRFELGIENGSGRMWVDNVQFEPNAYATPFTPERRLPHDEMLAARIPREPKEPKEPAP